MHLTELEKKFIIKIGYGLTAEVESYLENGIDINFTEEDGWTPLMHSISNMRPEISRLLINKGANINVIDNLGWTPLMFAVYREQFETIQLLIEFGVDVNIKNRKGEIALDFAKEEKVMQLLKNPPQKIDKQLAEIEWEEVYVI